MIEADSSTGFLVTSMEGVVAEHCKRVVGEKTREALSRLKARGLRYTHVSSYG